MALTEFLLKIFGDPMKRKINKVMPIVDHINALEPEFEKLTDEELRAKTDEFKKILSERPTSTDPKKDYELEKEALDKILPEAFATVREAGKRVLNMRHFDVQLIGGIFLHNGNIAEMRTGEGKTLVATLPAYLNALTGKGVHIVTVNDYLARRDRDWMGKIYEFLGLTVGVILSNSHYSPDEYELKKQAYNSDITYGTNNEFGFDYLRDNMASSIENCVQRPFNYAIVDEVDSILIDEARTPLIISGHLEKSAETYLLMSKIAPQLEKNVDYEVDEKNKNIILTEDGIDKAQELLHVDELFDMNTQYAHHLLQALRAKELYVKDIDYMIKNNEIMIVDEFTGRIMEGRRWSEGLHQAIEAKEGVPIQDETQTLASITFQNLFRLYPKLSGMTGTAMTEEAEFGKIYNLPVTSIPTNKPDIRINYPDVIYKTFNKKFQSVADEIETMSKKGRPTLVGTISIEKSEILSAILKKRGIKHNVLNAKHHEKEAYIIAQAGRVGAVTIATNMAGRGTDILLGGNPEYLAKEELESKNITPDNPYYEKLRDEALLRAQEITSKEHDEVVKLGGLHVIGTERHESRRIDNQLRGRAARQGDPGSTRFFLSLEDDLMRIFGGEKIANLMNVLNFDENTAIEHPLITNQIASAQKKVETYHFDIRKSVLEYDDVINVQREKFYAQRHEVLEKSNLSSEIKYMIDCEVERILGKNLSPSMSPSEYIEDDLKLLVNEMKMVFIYPENLKTSDIKDLRYTDIESKLKKIAQDAYIEHENSTINAFNEFMIKYGNPDEIQKPFDDNNILRSIEKDVLLRVIDAKWIDHLNNIDILRDNIGLVSYGQKEPLIEYKKEAFNLFNSMMAEIQSESVRHIFRAKFGIQIVNNEPIEQEHEVETELTRALKTSKTNNPEDDIEDDVKPYVREDKKIGRNELCPCGSGKKYKQCCGRNS